MLPSPSGFASAMEELGLGDGMRFVVMIPPLARRGTCLVDLAVFGAHDVKILAGGLPRWRAKGGASNRAVRRAPRRFTANFDRAAVADAAMCRRQARRSAQILDARARPVSWRGRRAAPGLRSGQFRQSQSALGECRGGAKSNQRTPITSFRAR